MDIAHNNCSMIIIIQMLQAYMYQLLQVHVHKQKEVSVKENGNKRISIHHSIIKLTRPKNLQKFYVPLVRSVSSPRAVLPEQQRKKYST